ncbi:MAG: hypothetical protein ABMB14_09875, partial [Myxococcota bacterium]
PVAPDLDLDLGGEELPTSPRHDGDDDRRLGGLRGPSMLGRVVDLVRRDSYVAVGTAVAGSLVLVFLTSALLRACG